MIEKIYRVSVDFDFETDSPLRTFHKVWEPFEKSMDEFGKVHVKKMEEFTIFSGNAASPPYIKIETTKKKMAEKLEKTVKKIILSHGGFIIQ